MPLTSAKGEDRNQTSVYQFEAIGLAQLGINPAIRRLFDCVKKLALNYEKADSLLKEVQKSNRIAITSHLQDLAIEQLVFKVDKLPLCGTSEYKCFLLLVT